MEDFLKWRDSWLTGIETLDIQHAELAACLNSIAKICLGKEDQDPDTCSRNTKQIELLISQLYEKTKKHFQYEEQLMIDAEYPDYSAHVSEHGMLLAELKLLVRTRFKSDSDSIDVDTLKALKSWFIVHVAHSDKLFAQFVSRQQVTKNRSGGLP